MNLQSKSPKDKNTVFQYTLFWELMKSLSLSSLISSFTEISICFYDSKDKIHTIHCISF